MRQTHLLPCWGIRELLFGREKASVTLTLSHSPATSQGPEPQGGLAAGQAHSQKAGSMALAEGKPCRGTSRHTVTVIGNNFLLCHRIYMQINVSNAHLPLPTINHYRLAHQFLNIIRSYRHGCNIILNTDTTLRTQLLLLLSTTLFLLSFRVQSGWV